MLGFWLAEGAELGLNVVVGAKLSVGTSLGEGLGAGLSVGGAVGSEVGRLGALDGDELSLGLLLTLGAWLGFELELGRGLLVGESVGPGVGAVLGAKLMDGVTEGFPVDGVDEGGTDTVGAKLGTLLVVGAAL